MTELVFATGNAGKLKELRELARDLPLRVLSLADVGRPVPEVVEDGATFAENAAKKAKAYAAWSDRPALADDSGLCVDALGGAPGVHSARWSGGSDEDNNEKLLAALAAVPDEKRGAEYRAVLALARPDGTIVASLEGICRGRIGHRRRGQGGFGYDPLFLLPDRGLTMAELPPDEKNGLSHRGRAFAALRPILERLARG
jgi:XTP/dITP diphosphohydrolase